VLLRRELRCPNPRRNGYRRPQGTRLHRYSVLIHGDKIAAVGPGIAAPKQAVVVEGAGKYVIPGMWTCMFSFAYASNCAVSCLRRHRSSDMGSELVRVKAWRAEIGEGGISRAAYRDLRPPDRRISVGRS